MSEPQTLHAAQRLLALGLSVIPVPRPRPGLRDGKVPSLPWREYQTRLPTIEEVWRWFSAEPMNLAVITGAVSGFVVVDLDSREAVRWGVKRLSYTPWQTETSKGFHLWYRHPGPRVPNRARVETADGRLSIDVRGDGGYVIVAPSIHETGVEYREAGDWSQPRESVPVFWPGWLARPQRPTARPGPAAQRPLMGDVIDRARKYLAAIPKPEIGMGSDSATLYAACRLTRGFGLSAADAEALLWEWAGGRSGWDREWVARKVSHASRYGTEPIGGLLA